ncbi:DUF917 domain-containing protein [Amycolatopsis jejuensis]|uniref:DUF917 domain-containing protein n=1 Tax=Amycolatopsis jejuensis TaxID=330084 RepID=UPI00068A6E90|nr:DUF917 domain-containing protein [Amycolatopsis jejuensis]
MRLTSGSVAALSAGCTLLGSGGGGATDVAETLLAEALSTSGSVEVGTADRLPDDALVVSIGAVGSPTAMMERIPSADEFVRAARATEQRLGRTIAAVQSLEIGGVNGLLGACSAAWLGLPLLDADAMGRAYPRLNLTVLAGEVPIGPLALSASRGEVVVLDAPDDSSAEALVRAMLPGLGSWAAVCLYPATAAEYGRVSVQSSVSRALRYGRTWQRLRAEGPELLHGISARQLYEGTVVEVLRERAEIGGVATIRHVDTGVMRLDFANEYVLAFDDGLPVCAAPDLIVVVDARTWKPISVENLSVPQRVRVLALPAPPELRRGGPAAERRFGLPAYDRDPVPAEGVPR